MELASFFLILAVLVWVVLIVSHPFLVGEDTAAKETSGQVDHELSDLLARRDNILAALQELDLDFTLGKVPEETYQPQRSMLVKRGVEVLRRLDSFPLNHEWKNPPSSITTLNGDSSYERTLPQKGPTPDSDMDVAFIDTKTARSIRPVVTLPDDDLEIMIAKRRRDRLEKSTGFCPMCGDPVKTSDRYCPRCGARIE